MTSMILPPRRAMIWSSMPVGTTPLGLRAWRRRRHSVDMQGSGCVLGAH
ncbi:hypothetical protein [Streptomyces sp. NPDC048256]